MQYPFRKPPQMSVPPKRSIFPSNLAMRYNRDAPSVRPNFKFCPREDFTEEPHAKAFAESRDFEIFGVPPSKRKIFDFKIPPRKSRGYSGARRRSQTRASDGRPALKSAPQRRIPPTRQGSGARRSKRRALRRGRLIKSSPARPLFGAPCAAFRPLLPRCARAAGRRFPRAFCDAPF